MAFTLLYAVMGRGQVVYGLLVAVPLAAALLLGRHATAAYAVLALHWPRCSGSPTTSTPARR